LPGGIDKRLSVSTGCTHSAIAIADMHACRGIS
jgi:hypothetical protein